MRQLALPSLLLAVLLVSLYAISSAQDPSPSAEKAAKAQQMKIIPLVTVKPGETKELLLSTWCTVGATRGGGFSLAEMRDGRPRFQQSTLRGTRSYSASGVTISVPDFNEGEKYASSSEYSLLKERHINAFKVTITASPAAKSGLLEMHLLDATCSGQCKTDFRVLVVDP